MERALKKGRISKAEDRGKLELRKTERIRAVTFDVGGTLIECWPSVGHIYAEVSARCGQRPLSPLVLNRRFRRAWKEFKDFGHTTADWSALVDATFCGLIEIVPSETFFPQLFERFSEPDAWHIFEDVLPTLTALKSRGLKLGIISNWDDRLRPLLARLNLAGHFETIIVSCEAGARKPDGRIFHSACAALGTQRAETLHVGDSREMDFDGARTAGLAALWLRRGLGRSACPGIGTLRDLDKI